jgi:hypothetical protein
MSSLAMAPEAEQPSKSFMERVIGVFISPGETFADIARKPNFIAPMVVMVVLTVAGTELFLAKIGLEPIIRYAIEHSSRTSNLSAEQIQQAVTMQVRIGTIFAHVLAVLGVPLGALIVALVGWIIVNNIFGGEIRFHTAFAIPLYADLVTVVSIVMGALLIFFGDPEHLISNPNSPTPTSLGFFLNPEQTSKALMSLASSFDIFTLWYIVLLGIGFSKASGKKASTGATTASFFGIWLVWVLIKMGLSTLGG